ncbi:MAG: hypothetical protein KBD44_02840 [Candidatus Pacebacteria bacterium]|jgi:hypothetical protein|nr:hypothetical protein [Candidatus Paceibacterota bacterium]
MRAPVNVSGGGEVGASSPHTIANVAQLVEHIHGGVKKTLAHNIGNDIVNPE